MFFLNNQVKASIELLEDVINLHGDTNESHGNIIKGRVRIENNLNTTPIIEDNDKGSIVIHQMKLNLVGNNQVNFTNNQKSYQAKQTILNQSLDLLQDNRNNNNTEDEVILNRGIHYFTFNFLIEGNLNNSITIKNGKLTYDIQLLFHYLPMNFKLNQLLPIKFYLKSNATRSINIHRLPLPTCPIMNNMIQFTNKSNDLTYNIYCLSSCFGNQDPVTVFFNFNLLNQNDTIDSIICLIKREIIYKSEYSNCTKTKNYILDSSTVLINSNTNSVSSVNEFKIDLNINKNPKQDYYYNCNNNLFTINHYLKIKINFKNNQKNLFLNHPICLLPLSSKDTILNSLPNYELPPPPF
ncbi:hypothetical protein K502DRAFT_350110 [Neoconidiobolus thromboides FSU 785]|nr:hypothetical protein K502DRAFT_350110 [Neoconidiobolus thromboides FSU 785]